MTKVLVIDDDASISFGLKDTFLTQGFEVDSAKDGEEGLNKVKAVRPDVILLDMLMPKMNGLEVLDTLKADSGTSGIPVVLYTNLDDEKDAETAISKGALAYITKTQYNPKELLDVLKQLLAKPS